MQLCAAFAAGDERHAFKFRLDEDDYGAMSAAFTLAVCDDEPDFRRALVERMAGDDRFAVTVLAGSVVELSRALADRPVDAILLDYVLPGIEGADAVRLVAARTGKPVFVMSDGLRHHLERRALAAGAAAFFPKQGAHQQLIETLHHHLAERATA